MAIGSVIGGLGSALIGANSASDAADAQTAAANAQIAESRRVYEEQQELFDPYYQTGVFANEAANSLLGLGPAPMIGGTAPEISAQVVGGGQQNAMANPFFSGEAPEWAENVNNEGPSGIGRRAGPGAVAGGPGGAGGSTLYSVGDQTFASLEEAQAWANSNLEGGTPYGGFQESPGYQFALSEGINSIDASASAGGSLYSGATIQDAMQFGQGLANQEFNNYYNQVAGQAAAGQAAAGQTAQAGSNYANSANNAYANIGNAQAAGSIGTANALMGGLNTGLGLYQYHNQLNGPQSSGNSTSGVGIGGLY